MQSSTAKSLARVAGWAVKIVLLLSVSGFLRALLSEGWDSKTRTTVLVWSLIPFALAMLFLLGNSIKDRIKYHDEPVVTLGVNRKKND